MQERINTAQLRLIDIPDYPQDAIARYNFDEGEGNRAFDLVGSNDLVETGSLGVAAGIAGAARTWDGNLSNYFSGPNPYGAAVTKAAFSCWIYFDNFSTNYNFLFQVFGTSLYPRLNYVVASDQLNIQYRLDGITKDAGITNFSVGRAAGAWYHVICEFDNSTGVKMYVDDVQVAENTDTGTSFNGGSSSMFVGRDSNLSYSLDGRVDELLLFDRTLSAAERTALFKYPAGGSVLSQYQDIKIYEDAKIVSISGTDLVIDKDFSATGLFRSGTKFFMGVGLGIEEEVEVDSVDGVNITLLNAPSNTHIVDTLVGVKKFAGNIIDIRDDNIDILANIEYEIKCLDYTKVLDKALVNDTHEDKEARYIINQALNVDINNNERIDDMEYDDNTAIQAAWTESGDGENPTISTSDPIENVTNGVFDWTAAKSGSDEAAWTNNSIGGIDISNLVNATTGLPRNGAITFWYKASSLDPTQDYDIELGTSSGNVVSWLNNAINDDGEWHYVRLKFKDLSNSGGTQDWTNVNRLKIFVKQTNAGDGTIEFDDFRIVDDGAFTMLNVQKSTDFDDFRLNRVKPTEMLQRLADELAWYWYVDYERNIHLFPESTNVAPFALNETSDNFTNLRIKYDTSKLINRQVLEGADETSESVYPQVIPGDAVVKEWIMKNKFKNLEVLLDDNTVTDLTEAGTTTTNITIVGHGLATGDYITNRSQGNAVREITKVDDDNFTVAAVTGQGVGDTLSFYTAKNVGVEGFDAEAGNDYMSNFNQKSIRVVEGADPPDVGDFLLFRYNEVFPIIVQRKENISIANMKSILGFTNGIFDGQKMIDRTIKSRPEATKVVEAKLKKYSNQIITATFNTTQEGLRTGQLISIKDTTSSTRNINQNFVIQKVTQKQVEEGENNFTVTASSLLFGVMELLQQLLRQGRKLEFDEDARIDNLEDADEIINIVDVLATAVDDNKQEESIDVSDAIATSVVTPPFQWQPGGANPAIWNLFSWS